MACSVRKLFDVEHGLVRAVGKVEQDSPVLLSLRTTDKRDQAGT